MTIEEFEKELMDDLKTFIENYRKSNKEDPVNWPLKMSSGEWWEQFIIG